MTIRVFLWACALLVMTPAVEAAEFRILYAEPIDLGTAELNSSATVGKNAAGTTVTTVSFEAYGRRFDLELEPNERLLSAMQASAKLALGTYKLYRGRLAGQPHSWVRLTRTGEDLRGMIWDGSDLYTIEPAREAARYTLSAVAETGSVIYRLSDTQSELAGDFCATVDPQDSAAALEGYRNMVGEIRQAAAATGGLTGQLEVAVLGDFEFFTDHPLDAAGIAVARMNNVDGIFSDQVGIRLVVPTVTIFNAEDDPFSDSRNANSLLQELGNYKRRLSSGLRNRGLVHLMTGRDLQGQTVGIAYVHSLCDISSGASLSQGGSEISSTSATLVAAHEIGHNFGAPHDAEAGSACESTPASFLMAPRVNGSNTFSQCSLTQMQPEIASAACIAPVAFSDAAIDANPATLNAQVDQALAWPITVSVTGTLEVDSVIVTVSLPSTIALLSASVPNGSCAPGAGSVTCDLGTLAGASTRRIDLSLRGSEVGTFQSSVLLTADNDADAQNNSRNVSLSIRAATPASATGGRGGGGSLEWMMLAGLLAAAQRKRSSVRGPSS